MDKEAGLIIKYPDRFTESSRKWAAGTSRKEKENESEIFVSA